VGGSIRIFAFCEAYRAWKCGGSWSLYYMAMTIPKNRLISGIGPFCREIIRAEPQLGDGRSWSLQSRKPCGVFTISGGMDR
jgi:hypothetical protein